MGSLLSPSSRILLLSFYALFFTLSLVGNITVLVVCIRVRSLRKSIISSFIISLAVSDLLITCFCMPINLASVFTTLWTFGAFACKMVPFVQNVGVASSLMTMSIVALDRYHAIVHPLKTKFYHTMKRAIVVLSVVWIFSVCVSLPNAVCFSLRTFSMNVTNSTGHIEDVRYVSPTMVLIDVCLWDEEKMHLEAMFWINLIGLFAQPLTLMTVAYIGIGHSLWIRTPVSDMGPNINHVANEQRMRQKKRIVLMMILVVIFFVMCWMPIMLFNLIALKIGLKLNTKWLTVRHFLQCLAMMSTCVNPIIYTFLHDRFRKGFVNVAKCKSERIVPSVTKSNDTSNRVERRGVERRATLPGAYVPRPRPRDDVGLPTIQGTHELAEL